MPVDPLCAVPYGHDRAIRSKHCIGIEMGFEPLVGIAGDLPAKLGSSFMVEEEDRPSSMIMGRVLADLVDSLEGLTLRDVHSLARLSRQLPKMSADSLVSLYRYGERHSPWEQLNQEKLGQATDTLKARVKGQDQAIRAVNKILIRA